jgi:hypothetical protein
MLPPWDQLWIDAVCIVQKKPNTESKRRNTRKAKNSRRKGRNKMTADEEEHEFKEGFNGETRRNERNQQVQMMGDIYQGRYVLSWLGNDDGVGHFIRDFHKTRDIFLVDSANGRRFMYNKYWLRAWITQEIELARDITILSGKHILELRGMQAALENSNWLPCSYEIFEWATDDNYFWHLLWYLHEKRQRNSLIHTLHKYRKKQSTILADRIYSIRAISNDGLMMTVDYAMSRTQLMVETLRACPSSLCLCSFATVARTLNITQRQDYKGDLWMNKYGLRFKLRPTWLYEREAGVDAARCPECRDDVPDKFDLDKGHGFCLKAVCHTAGHVFWKNSQPVRENPGCDGLGTFHYQPDYRAIHKAGRAIKYNFKCDEPLVIHLTNPEGYWYEQKFDFRLTFACLIKLFRMQLIGDHIEICGKANGPVPEEHEEYVGYRKKQVRCEFVEFS